jgi:hypothetical protein
LTSNLLAEGFQISACLETSIIMEFLCYIAKQFSRMKMSSIPSSPLDLMPSSSSIVECYCGDNNCRQCNLLLQMEGEGVGGVKRMRSRRNNVGRM